MNVFSYSRISKYDTCPHLFKEIYIEGKEEKDKEPGVVGKTVHKALEFTLNKGLELDKAVDQAIEEEATIPVDVAEIKTLTSRGLAIIEELGIDLNNVTVEAHFQTPLDADDPMTPQLQGYIDIAADDFILDWKTGRSFSSPKDTYQLPLYLWGWSKKIGKDITKGAFSFLRKSTKVPELEELDKIFIEEAVDWAKKNAEEIQGKVLELNMGGDPDKLFPAIGGSHCRYCDWPSECPLTKGEGSTQDGQANTESEEIQSEDEALQVANEIMNLQARGKALQEKLKVWVENKGPVEAGDQIFSFTQSDKWEFKDEGKAELAKLISDKGESPWSYFKIGKPEIDKLKEKVGIEEEVLLQYGKKKEQKTFKPKKKEQPQKKAN